MKNASLLNSTNDFSGNNIVNVLVITGKYEGVVTVRKFDDLTQKHYNSGYWWDLWKHIEEQLEDKYVFKYHYTDPNESPNYNQICKDVSAGKYDMCLGLFRRTREREGIVNYCAPVLIDATAVYYKDEGGDFLNAVKVIKKVWKSFLFLLVLGIVFGLILSMFQKSRVNYMQKYNKHNFVLRLIMTGVAAVFGEMGYLSERSPPNLKSLIITTIMIMIAFIIILYIQGEVTTILVNQEVASVNKSNLNSKPLLGQKGYADLEALEDQGANTEPKDETLDDIFKLYMKNPKKYLGIGLTYTDGLPYGEKYGLDYALGFGFHTQSCVVNERFKELREDVNVQIDDLRNRGKLQRICRSFFGNLEDVPTCTLR